MANESETVREVCAEMEYDKGTRLFSVPFSVRAIWLSDLREYAKRIIAAYERELAAKDEMARIAAQSAQDRFDEELAAKDAEIARLNDELFAYAGGHVITGSERFLREKNKKLEEEIARLKDEIKAKKNRINGLVTDVQHKNGRIGGKIYETLRLEKRIALLEAALKPVMGCDTKIAYETANTIANSGTLPNVIDSDNVSNGIYRVCNAVREAQRVMMEGGEK